VVPCGDLSSASISCVLGLLIGGFDEMDILLSSLICCLLGLVSNGGFFGTGGAGFRATLEDVDTTDAWLGARGRFSRADGCSSLICRPAMGVDDWVPSNGCGWFDGPLFMVGWDGLRVGAWSLLTFLQSGSAVGVKGFEGLFGFRTDLSSGALTFDRAGNPSPTESIVVQTLDSRTRKLLTIVQPPLAPVRACRR